MENLLLLITFNFFLKQILAALSSDQDILFFDKIANPYIGPITETIPV